MGMDVYGNSGNYFRNNIFYWHPLATYIQKIAPEIARNNPEWHSNHRTGLDAADSVRLANKLQEEIDSGRCQQYAAQLPLEPTSWTFKDGQKQSSKFALPFRVNNVQDFVRFLRESKGFEIH
jgi:hypothetical protein